MASRKERKAMLDAMSDEELYGSDGFMNRHGGEVRDGKGWTPKQKRDANIKRVLDGADGKHGDFVDGLLMSNNDDVKN